ncbi:MAG: hypothetical protein O9325_19325 [Roseomonas sp.]|nr:hypothetical protein [Roseomonas sp.]
MKGLPWRFLAFLLLMIGWSAPSAATDARDCLGGDLPAVEGFGEARPLSPGEAARLFHQGDGVLTLTLRRGPVELRDHENCSADPMTEAYVSCVRHEFVAAFAEPSGFLVRRSHYEHQDYIWVDREWGTQLRFSHLPRFSPGHRWLVSVSPSEAGHVFNGIELFELGPPRTPKPMWRHVPAGAPEDYYLFSFLRWTGPESALLCALRENDGTGRCLSPEPVEMRRGPLGWALRSAVEAASACR